MFSSQPRLIMARLSNTNTTEVQRLPEGFKFT
jgi:hypothetical protein